MLILVETPAGYGLFRVEKSKLLSMDQEALAKEFATGEKAQKAVSLKAFGKFKDTKDALAESSALIDSKLGRGLKKFLRKEVVKKSVPDELVVCDKQLGGIISKKLNIDVVWSPEANEIIRGIRTQLHELVAGISEKDTRTMSLSLSHTLNRFKLKFSPEKVDTMIIQAVGLLDDLDRELNNFAMRLKEWYGWHFPELTKIVTDNMTYAKTVKAIGMRSDCQDSKTLDSVLPEEILKEVKEAAEVSMGTEITQEDLDNIFELCERVIELTEYRASLAEYLKFRMDAIAPNLTHMVGELVGARLVAHAGSLMGLAKHPSSTVQILGAEKALFRALKQKTQTPKYGLIYHAGLVGQSATKIKGKISRVLAAKLSLCTRVDALGEHTDKSIGIACRQYVERRIEELQQEVTRGASHSMANAPTQKYVPKKRAQPPQMMVDGVKNGNEVKKEEGDADVPPKKKRKKSAE